MGVDRKETGEKELFQKHKLNYKKAQETLNILKT